jgi:hypothetical protein
MRPLSKEVETDTAALLDGLRDLDLQFADPESGPPLHPVLEKARIIVDAGHGPHGEEEPTSPPPATLVQ